MRTQLILAEILYSFRSLSSDRGYLIGSVFSLAVGIGGATVFASVLVALLLPPLPYRDQDRLAVIRPTATWELFERLKLASAFDAVAAYNEQAANLVGGTEPQRILIGRVTSDFMRIARVSIIAGRAFTEADYEVGHEDVALLTARLWRQQYGAADDIVGRTIWFDERPYTVVGVVDDDFKAPTQIGAGRGLAIESGAAVLTPLQSNPVMANPNATDRLWRGLYVIVHFRDEVEIARARSELDAIASESPTRPGAGHKYTLVPFGEFVRGDVPQQLAIVTLAVGLLLVVACANFSNLALARWARQQVPQGTRLALGASREQLVRLPLLETMSVSILGGAAGLGAALIGVKLIASLGGEALSGLDLLRVDGRVAAFGVILTFLTGALVGALPARRCAKFNPADVLRGDQGAGDWPSKSFTLTSLLVVVEIALCLAALICSGTLMQALLQETRVELGFRTENVLTADISLSPIRYPTVPHARAFFRELLDRASVLPGVDSVSIGNTAPGGPATTIANVTVRRDGDSAFAGYEGSAESPVRYETVSANYFGTLGIGTIAGRPFNTDDAISATPVAVVNEAFARQQWLDAKTALGRQVAFGRRAFTIIGVAKDVRGVRAKAEPAVYFLYEQFPQPPKQVTLFLHSGSASMAFAEPLRRLVQSLDPSQPVYNVRTLERIVLAPLARLRFISSLTAVFSLLATLIAAVGLYSAMSRAVDERRTELAIRLALGSSPRRLFRDVLGRAVWLVLSGIAFGLLAAYFAVPVLRANVIGLHAAPADSTLAAALLTVFAVSIGGAIVPALRAAAVDPMVLLRRQ